MHANYRHKYSSRKGLARTIMTLCGLIAIAWSIVTVESSLLWSNITGVNGILSAGQIIPAIVGITSLLKTLNSIILKSARNVSHISKYHLLLKLTQMIGEKIGTSTQVRRPANGDLAFRPPRRQNSKILGIKATWSAI
jgi:hypothetical protein